MSKTERAVLFANGEAPNLTALELQTQDFLVAVMADCIICRLWGLARSFSLAIWIRSLRRKWKPASKLALKFCGTRQLKTKPIWNWLWTRCCSVAIETFSLLLRWAVGWIKPWPIWRYSRDRT